MSKTSQNVLARQSTSAHAHAMVIRGEEKSQRWAGVVLMLLLFVLTGCGGLMVNAQVLVPAAMPLRTFPHVHIGHEGDEDSSSLARLLASELSRGRTQAEVIARHDLEQRRATGAFSPASVVVLIQVEYQRTYRTTRSNQPDTVCGPSGCRTRTIETTVREAVLRGTCTLRVFDGPSASLLQQTTFSSDAGGGLDVLLRDRVMTRLREKLLALLDRRWTRIEVRLLSVELEGVDAALEALSQNRWERGRRELENLAGQAERLPPEARAAFLYNLGIARRFDETTITDPDAHFADAERAIQAAVRLDPKPLYHDALVALRRHQAEYSVLQAQQSAASHNFALQRQHDQGGPAVPEGYE